MRVAINRHAYITKMIFSERNLFLLLERGPLEDGLGPGRVVHLELVILRSLLSPRRIELGCVLIHKMGVLCPTRSSKILDLLTNLERFDKRKGRELLYVGMASG